MEELIKHTCPVCHKEYLGEVWKRKCFDCYKNFSYRGRIHPMRHKENIYLTHPSVTKEELDKWIKEKGLETGWGVQEYSPTAPKFKIWVDDTNFD